MKSLPLLFFFITIVAFSQKTIKTAFVKKTELTAQSIVSVTKTRGFENIKYINNNTLFEKLKDSVLYNYSNVQLGEITSVDAFSPLKVKLFYKRFNTIIALDNRLTETDKIDFNTIKPYKNVSHVSTGFGNRLWIFNQDLQQLELYDFKRNKVSVKSTPMQSNVLDLKSDYNYCWLLTENYLYKYDSWGSLIYKIENKNYTAISVFYGNMVLQSSNNGLYYLSKGNQNIVPIEIPELLIKQFLLTRGSLYIYDNEFLHEYQILKE